MHKEVIFLENNKYITVCPYCNNKSRIEINNNEKRKNHTCPHCFSKYKILIERKVILYSEVENKNYCMNKKIEKEVQRKNGLPLMI